jgi:hypothetical protein
MRPPRKEYERVPVGVPVIGIIEKVQYDEKHTFKAFKEGDEDTIGLAIRFKFKLDGCEHAHYSRWMKLNVGEKANLYKKYLTALVENAVPDMDIELDILNGMAVKTVWKDNGDFQNLESIEAIGKKVSQIDPLPVIVIGKDEEPPIDPASAPF